MAEVFTIIGLVGNIVSFVDYAYKAIVATKDAYGSATGLTQEVAKIDDIVKGIQQTSRQLLAHPSAIRLSKEELAITNTQATRCLQLAKELNGLLDKLRVREDAPRAIEITRVALQWQRKKGHIESLERRLCDLDVQVRAGLTKILLHEHHSSTNLEFRSLIRDHERHHIESMLALDQIRSDILALSRASKQPETSNQKAELTSLSTKLFALTKEGDRASKQYRVIQSLYFTSLKSRYSAIEDAHTTTLTWLFDQSKTSFVNWLETHSGIYWISGLAGSGKSTLMKFASKHPETIAALDKWANGETLITASFFFWNQGLAMQKTQLGLFQSLLYQVLRAAPELVSVLCPDHEIDEGWEIDDLKQTFQLLSRQKILPVKFCFFIDGLDEYNGEEEDILEVLNNLASSPNVKICTSSRPWPAFEEAFADLQRTLAVQDFTLDDMKSYVRDRLAEHPKFLTLQQEDSRCTKLIAQIAETSQGVWLWTYLVTNDMRSLIAHNEKYEMLHRTLESFPPRLEEYFANIIERRNPAFREEMCQIFLITAEAVQPVPILLFTYLQPQIQNAKYAINYDIMPISKWEVDDNYFDWRHQLHNRCGDLLRIECENEIDNFFRYRVDFLHRTVRDFLRDNHDGKLREGAGLTFNPTSSLCHLTLVLLKRFPVHNEFRANINRIIQLVDEILYYSHEAEKRGGPAQVELLDELDRVVSLFAKKEQNHWTHARDPPASGSLQKYTEGGNYNFLALAIQSRLVRYVRAKLDADPSLIGKKRGRPLLDYALRPKRKMPLSLAFHSQKEDISVSVAMVQLLLERGANPNQPIYLYDKQTVWELFLLSCSEHAEWASERLKSVWYEAVLMMIEHGARPLHSKDVRVTVSGRKIPGTDLFRMIFPPKESSAALRRMREMEVLNSRQSWSDWIGNLVFGTNMG